MILSIDPGRKKCGIAIISKQGQILEKAIVAPDEVKQLVELWVTQYHCQTLVLGASTGSKAIDNLLGETVKAKFETIAKVNEYRSTDEARKRYWLDHPPKGLKKLLPTSMQTPPEPYDDYAAVVLAERYLAESKV